MTRARCITEQVADAAIDAACRMLRLPTIRARFAEPTDKAEHDQLTYRGFLAVGEVENDAFGSCRTRRRRAWGRWW
jgi:hypothetical protein